mgnify:FL=1
MQILEKQVLNFNLSLLLCSLYTLFEFHKIFKRLNLKEDIFLNVNNIDYFSKNKEGEISKEFYMLVNKLSLRQLSYFILKPFLSSNYFNTFSPNNKVKDWNKGFYNEMILVKKYLQKFKYNYKRYFFSQNGTFVNLPPNKELNMYAIKLLFLITGI